MAKKSGTDWGQILLIGALGGGGLLIFYGYTKWVESGSQGNPVAGTLGSAAGIIVNPIESTLQTAGLIAGGATGLGIGGTVAYKMSKGIMQAGSEAAATETNPLSNLGSGIADWFGNIGSKLIGSGSDVVSAAEPVINDMPSPTVFY
jgi:hypothetical protein